MQTPPYYPDPLGPPGNPRSECVYRGLTLVAMLLLLVSMWAF